MSAVSEKGRKSAVNWRGLSGRGRSHIACMRAVREEGRDRPLQVKGGQGHGIQERRAGQWVEAYNVEGRGWQPSRRGAMEECGVHRPRGFPACLKVC